VFITISMSVIIRFLTGKHLFRVAKESGYPILLLTSVFSGSSAASFVTAVQYTLAANIMLIFSTAPLFVALSGMVVVILRALRLL